MTTQTITIGSKTYQIASIKSVDNHQKLPFSIKVLLENLLRNLDQKTVTQEDIDWFANWSANKNQEKEIAYRPARVLMQDFTGVPAVVDLASMRDAMEELGGDVSNINPLQPAELVIDHSVQVDHFGKPNSLDLNTKIEYQRNKERYQFLKWGQQNFSNFKVVPPGAGIVHQVNIEYLAKCVFEKDDNGKQVVYPDTVVGTDSHTTMVNGLGVLGWGVGGIEAEAAMLGQPISMLIPQVVGVKLTGNLAEGITATDLVLRVVEVLRKLNVVGKFVEFFGEGLQDLSLADRATIANMAPEYGATCGIFPVDNETLEYLRLTNRTAEQIELVKAYYSAQGMFVDDNNIEAEYNQVLEIDLATIVPSLAGPKRPQDRIALNNIQQSFQEHFNKPRYDSVKIQSENQNFDLQDGAVVIAAITSCTNTSNPSVMLGAGLVAKKAYDLGVNVKPWVKTSLAPGSKVVTEYLEKSGLNVALDALGFNTVGYGCTTCIGNSGPLPEAIDNAINNKDLTVCAVLSGNRNFEGRVHPQVKMNYLASPPLVVAYAIAGTMNIDLTNEPIAQDSNNNPIYLKDIWPSKQELTEVVNSFVTREQFEKSYGTVFDGDQNWQNLETNNNPRYTWPDSSYVKKPPFFDNINQQEEISNDILGIRVLALLGDSVTTDHISPAGSIKADSPAGCYLKGLGIAEVDFNSYGSRRGNHEVMMRGTFANIRLHNQLLPDTEGGVTKHIATGKQMSIYDAAMQYKQESTPIMIIAGKEYGTGSSRDWAAKGCKLLGVQVVLAESFERIHRTNLVGMGILPLQFVDGQNASSLGLTGEEKFDIINTQQGHAKQITVSATNEQNGTTVEFTAKVRIDTPQEIEYYQNGGILRYVLRQLANA